MGQFSYTLFSYAKSNKENQGKNHKSAMRVMREIKKAEIQNRMLWELGVR